MDRDKIERSLDFYQKSIACNEKFIEIDGFLLAICYVVLGEFNIAQGLFEKSCMSMFGPKKVWEISAHPDWFVDVWVLSGRKDLYPKIVESLEIFQKDQMKSIANSLLTQYSCCLVELLHPTGTDISKWIQNLTTDTRIKDMFAIGQVIQAIIDRDNNAVNAAMEKLLIAHT